VDKKVKDQIETIFLNLDSKKEKDKENDKDKENETQIAKEKENKKDETFHKHRLEQIKENLEFQPIDDKFNFTQLSLRSNNLNDYEELLQKLENDIRNHIKIQHQYRIYSDNLKLKIEELEKINKEQKNSITDLNEVYLYINLIKKNLFKKNLLEKNLFKKNLFN
jgi:hypothetical protein